MAERRMFSKTIMESDNFSTLSDKSKLLYLYLNLSADDDGFIGSTKRVMLFVESEKSDLEELIKREYVIQFDSGVCVIKHWKAHNYLRNDRYHPTLFQQEKSQLGYDEGTRTYYLVDKRYTNGIQSGRQMVDADKIRQEEISKEKTSLAKRSVASDFDEIGNRFFSNEEDEFPIN